MAVAHVDVYHAFVLDQGFVSNLGHLRARGPDTRKH